MTNDRLIGRLQAMAKLDNLTDEHYETIDQAIEALHRADLAPAPEPPANPSALKCHTCKRPFEEMAASELREYMAPSRPPNKPCSCIGHCGVQSKYGGILAAGVYCLALNRPASGEPSSGDIINAALRKIGGSVSIPVNPDARDAERYRWLRNGNAYIPEEEGIRGGESLDKLCDENRS